MIDKTDPPRIFNSIGYIVKPYSTYEVPTAILWYYPSVTKGKYRLTKDYLLDKDRPARKPVKYYTSTEFEVK